MAQGFTQPSTTVSGSAGGDLSGSYPNPSVVKINGIDVSTVVATSRKILVGNGTAFVSSTETWATPGAAGYVLVSDGTNWVNSTPKFPNASATAGKFIRSDGTDWIASTPTLPTTAGTSGKLLISDGTNWVSSTPTYPNSSASSGKIIISDGTNFVASTPTYPNTSASSGKILVSDGTNFVASTPTYPNASASSRKIVVSDGTNFVASTETWAVPGTSGNVLTSDGTNWTSAAASGGSWVYISTGTASSSSSIDFTGLSSTYFMYAIFCDSIAPATDSVSLLIRTSTNNGSSYDSGASDYTYAQHGAGHNSPPTTSLSSGSTAADSINIGLGIGNSTQESWRGVVYISNPSGTNYCTIYGMGHRRNATPNDFTVFFTGMRLSAADVDAVRFLFSSGNIATGTFKLYGIKAS